MRNYFRAVNRVPPDSVGERHAGRVTILDLEGDVTIYAWTAALRHHTRRLIAEGHTDILLNLAGVRYVDSSGLGEMVAAQLAARREGGRVALLAPTPNVREVFNVTRMARVFDIYEDEAGALRGMGTGRD
jgi:anti-sigma B factor antagonist